MNKKQINKYLFFSVASGYLKNSIGLINILILLPLLLSKIGTEIFGQWSIIYLFISLANFFQFGLYKTVVIFGSNSKFLKNFKSFNELFSIVFYLKILIVLIVLLILISIKLLNFDFFIINSFEKIGNVNNMMIIFFLIFFFNQFSNLFRSLLEAKLYIKYVHLTEGIMLFLIYFTMLLQSNFTIKTLDFLYSTIIIMYMALTFYVFFCFKILKLRLIKCNISSGRLLVRSCANFYIFQLSNISILALAKILILKYESFQIYAIYEISLKIINFLISIFNNLSMPLLSLYSKLNTYIKNHKYKFKILHHITLFNFIIYIISIILFYFFGKLFLVVLFKEIENIDQLYFITYLFLITVFFDICKEPPLQYLFSINKILEINIISYSKLLIFLTIVYILEIPLNLKNICITVGISSFFFSLFVIFMFFYLTIFKKKIKKYVK